MFEALRTTDPDLNLVAPVDCAALTTLLDPADGIRIGDRPAVLWLADLEPFVNEGLDVRLLEQWCNSGPGRFVVAASGGKGVPATAESAGHRLGTLLGTVLNRATQIGLTQTTPDELEPLRSRVPAADFAAIERHGLAAFLVAGPKLENILNTGCHPGDPQPCWEGVAVVEAAVDWSRCGRTDPIDEDLLRHLWSDYTTRRGVAPTDEGFQAGLTWSTRHVSRTIALLERTGGYQAFDYVVRLIRDRHGTEPPPEAMWTAAADTATDAQALTVGITAYENRYRTHAGTALDNARHALNSEVAAIAGTNLGVTLGDLGRHDDAITAYDHVETDYGHDTTPAIREAVESAAGARRMVPRDDQA